MELTATELLDCQGRVTHRLVLEIDGTVTVVFAASGVQARVDPATATVMTPGVRVPHEVMNAASTMRVR